MNLRDLEYFYQLAKLKSYTAAAQYFQVSQPTITYAIKRLEKNWAVIWSSKTRHIAQQHLLCKVIFFKAMLKMFYFK